MEIGGVKQDKRLSKAENYQPTRFMLPTSHYDKAKADRQLLLLRIYATQKANGQVRDSGCCLAGAANKRYIRDCQA